MDFRSWVMLLFGLTAIVISPFVGSWEAFGGGLLFTLVPVGLWSLEKWMDRNIK